MFKIQEFKANELALFEFLISNGFELRISNF